MNDKKGHKQLEYTVLRKHERRLQRQLRDAHALLVRIPRQNIVVTASPGLSVAVLPESLDVDLLVC